MTLVEGTEVIFSFCALSSYPDVGPVGILHILVENPESRSICVWDRKTDVDFDICFNIFK